MKDVYFNDYKKKKDYSRSAKQDTSEIPITYRERELQERINQQRYEQIIRSQNAAGLGGSPEPNVNKTSKSENKRKEAKPPKQKKKKRRGCGCLTSLMCFVLVIALLCFGSVKYLYSLFDKTNYVESEYNEYISSSALTHSDDIYNVLLIGTDTDDGGTSRSDTMMLVSLDKKTKQVKFTSFMRDMWVEIPDHYDAKLNAAFAYGGAQLVTDTIEYNFKIDIDRYIMVDFEMFQKLIDGVGGVTVDITEREAEFINRTSHAKVKAGINTLDGDYALIYCRIRKLDSDFMRTQRQRKVMAALMKQLTEQSIFKTAETMVDILPLITTDIPKDEMLRLTLNAFSLLKYGNDEMRIPADGMYQSETIRGQSALVPDLDANRKELQSFIYGK